MNKPIFWALALVATSLITTPLMADDKPQAAAEKTAEATKPTLTFYYFDK